MCSRYFMEENIVDQLDSLSTISGLPLPRQSYDHIREFSFANSLRGASAEADAVREHLEEEVLQGLSLTIQDKGRGQSEAASFSRRMFRARDVHPSEAAPAIAADLDVPTWRELRWGYPSTQGKGVIINARAESLLEKPMFRRSALARRIILPASGFYEWNAQKEKNIFRRKDRNVLYMAGIFDLFPDGERFVIVTTAANESMRPVHGRMPLILEGEQIKDWLFDAAATEDILHSTPALLDREIPYEQMSIFDLPG